MLSLLLSVALCTVILDYALHFTRYASLIPRYSFVYDYYAPTADGWNEIRPNYPTTTVPFFDQPYEIWSNNIGCFDAPVDPKLAAPFVYLTGDSSAWGFAPYSDKWGTVFEQALGIRVLKCGAPGFGTHAELRKTTKDLALLPPPALIVIGYSQGNVVEDAIGDAGARPYVCQVPGMPVRCWLNTNWLSDNSVLYHLLFARTWPLMRPRIAPTPSMYEANFDNIDRFARLAEHEHARLLVVLMPPEQTAYSGASAYTQVKSYLEQNGIAYMDPTSQLHAQHQNGLSLYWEHDSHLNSTGNRLVGLLVARYVIEHDLVPLHDADAAEARIDEAMRSLSARE